jgi:hypothetical protein
MKRLTSLLIGLLGFFVAPLAHAATVSVAVSYSRPTTYENGSALPPGAIASYGIGCTFTPVNGSAAPCASMSTGIFAGTATSGSFSFVAPDVGGRLCVQLVTRTAAGIEGSPSALTSNSCKDVVVPPQIPNAPGSVTIVVTVTVT